MFSYKLLNLKRFFSNNVITNNIKAKVCIVGAGPAGFYAAQHLIKKCSNIEVDIYERLPVPYGLVRFGVAPDHPEVKNVIHTFEKTAQHPSVRFIGNVTLGKHVTFQQLKNAYHIVLLTYGAEENRRLNIKGEDLKNVIPARKIVGWYNGLPWDQNLNIDLNHERVAIIGQGNVAIDVARMLLSPIDQLKTTDITEYALAKLSNSKVKEVLLIGRRGPLQAAFTIKELREMLKLPNCTTRWRSSDFKGVEAYVSKLERPKKRITELMLKSLKDSSNDISKDSKIFKPIFYRSPIEFQGVENVQSLSTAVCTLLGDDLFKQTAVLTDERELFDCGLAITSIGYQSVPVDGDLPFNKETGTLDNKNSKISDGVYTTGWVATGPTGVILTTMGNAFATADLILNDLNNILKENKAGFDIIKTHLEGHQIVSWQDWLKIDKFEVESGQKVGKSREKVVDIKKMLHIAAS